jgi:hypothetical protein
VSAAHEHHRVDGRNRIQIAPIRQPLLAQLRLVPVAVADDDVAGLAVRDAGFDGGQDIGDRPRAREVDAGSTAGVVDVAVRQTGNDRLAATVEDFRVRPGEGADGVVAADRDELCRR